MEDGDLNADQANDLTSADIDESERRGEDPTARQRKRRVGTKFNDSDRMWTLRLQLDPETRARVEARIGAINRHMWHGGIRRHWGVRKNGGQEPGPAFKARRHCRYQVRLAS
jgi:hypothetical protein